MDKVNNLSDIEIQVTFKDLEGDTIPVPDYDFEVAYFVKENSMVTAGRYNGVLSANAKIVDGKLYCYFDSPDFGKGRLRTRKTYHVPSVDFPDGERRIVIDSFLDVTID